MKRSSVLLLMALLIVTGLIFYLESLKVKPSTFADETLKVETQLDERIKNLVIDNITSSSEKVSDETPETSDDLDPNPIDEDIARITDKESKYPKAPELVGISGYLNTDDKITISQYLNEGKIVLIDFWTYTCINCIRTLPYLTDWHAKYKDQGLAIIGVHTPEFDFEKDSQNVKDAIEKYKIEYPVVQDNDYITWQAFNNRYWPRKYLIDSDGFIRYDHIGEGAYLETEIKIQKLLEEKGMTFIRPSDLSITQPKLPLTPELYAGYKFAFTRNQNIANGGLIKDQTQNYILSTELEPDKIYLEGKWKSHPDYLEATTDASIHLNFRAFSVNIVADNINAPVEMQVLINDIPISIDQSGADVEDSVSTINSPRLYNIVDGNSFARYDLELKVQKGFTFNAFTFG